MLTEAMQWHPLRVVGSHVGAPQGPVHLSPRFSESHIFEEIPERGGWGSRTASRPWAGCSSCSDYTHPLWTGSQALPRVLLPRAGEEHTREGERPSARRQGTPQGPRLTLQICFRGCMRHWDLQGVEPDERGFGCPKSKTLTPKHARGLLLLPLALRPILLIYVRENVYGTSKANLNYG